MYRITKALSDWWNDDPLSVGLIVVMVVLLFGGCAFGFHYLTTQPSSFERFNNNVEECEATGEYTREQCVEFATSQQNGNTAFVIPIGR